VILWIDAQLSPYLAAWIAAYFGIEAYPVRDLGLRNATDRQIFGAAREAGAVVMTKDSDFLELLDRFGPPPRVLWITCGNTSNERLRAYSGVHSPLHWSVWRPASPSSRSVTPHEPPTLLSRSCL
jgi:predicted nuclease of predicted toxin-antitoxin system